MPRSILAALAYPPAVSVLPMLLACRHPTGQQPELLTTPALTRQVEEALAPVATVRPVAPASHDDASQSYDDPMSGHLASREALVALATGVASGPLPNRAWNEAIAPIAGELITATGRSRSIPSVHGLALPP